MKYFMFKGGLYALVTYILLILVGSFIWSLDFDGQCGLYGDRCNYSEYFIGNLGWWLFLRAYFIFYLPLFCILGIVSGYCAHKLHKSFVLVHLTNCLVFLVTLLALLSKPSYYLF